MFSGALLSPDGRHLAVRVAALTGRVRLAVIDLATMKSTILASFDDADVGVFAWVNDQRVVLNVTDNDLARGDVRYGPGLYAVNVDGSHFRPLVSRSYQGGIVVNASAQHLLPWNTKLLQVIGQQTSDDVYVTQSTYSGPGVLDDVALLRLNTLTGRTQAVPGPTATMGWLIDRDGLPRVAESVKHGNKTLYYKGAADDDWRPLASFAAFGARSGAFSPITFGPDGTLYVQANYHGKGALFAYDTAKGAMAATPVVQIDNYDFHGHLVMNQRQVLGVTYQLDAYTTLWFDPTMKAMQAAIDQALPHAVNTLNVPSRPAAPYVLVTSYSDVQPLRFLLYNTVTHQLSPLGDIRPGIDPARMSPMKMVHYKARDGLDIPAYLTLPQGHDGKNLPLVVLVHGGPWMRGGTLEWNPEVQFLASRGYAVLQPEYRGSTGYGHAHFQAGWKQWGLKMQDDIADGARWAVAQGIAAPQRICIAGASYGGYSALMGLVNDPDVFRCGIDWAGVTDITLLQKGSWSGDSNLWDVYKDYGMPLLVGDSARDAAQLRATSPIAQAARITQPLLLAYGSSDPTVPLVHGTRFYDAVKDTNPNVEWVVYDGEGHGWALPKNSEDFWGRVERFLDRNIGH